MEEGVGLVAMHTRRDGGQAAGTWRSLLLGRLVRWSGLGGTFSRFYCGVMGDEDPTIDCWAASWSGAEHREPSIASNQFNT